MGFSVKVMLGLSLRASSRGVGAGIGPRIERVNVEAGRTGLPSGLDRSGSIQAAEPARRGPEYSPP